MLSKPAQKNQMLERYLLHDLFLEPEGLFRLNKTLCNLELDPITESDFQNADTLAGYHLIAESLRQVDYTPSDFVEARLTSALEFEEIPALSKKAHDYQEKRDQHQVRAVVRMRLNRLEDRLEEIKFLQSDAVESKTYTEEEVQFLYLELLQKRRRLDAAMLAPEAGSSTRVRVASSIKVNPETRLKQCQIKTWMILNKAVIRLNQVSTHVKVRNSMTQSALPAGYQPRGVTAGGAGILPGNHRPGKRAVGPLPLR